MTPNLVFVGGLVGLAALSAVGVVAFNNAVRSALCLVVNFFLLAFLYFTLNAEMLGITQIMVYLGAIMVLVLFVIMLLNLSSPQSLVEKFDFKRPIGIAFGLALAGLVGAQVMPGLLDKNTVGALTTYGTPQHVGRTLFTEYVVPFEAVSVLLLVGIVGSILLAKRKI